MLLTNHPLLVPWSWKSRAIPLPTLWATTGPVMGTLYTLHIIYYYQNHLNYLSSVHSSKTETKLVPLMLIISTPFSKVTRC